MSEYLGMREVERFWNENPPLESHTLQVSNIGAELDCMVYAPDGGFVAGWSLHPMPFCCGVLVSGYARVHPDHRGKGIGRKLNHWRQRLAKHLNFGLLICTDVLGNVPQQAVLNQEGWQILTSFTNPKTRHRVEVRGKELKDVSEV